VEEVHGFIENVVFTEEAKGFTVARLKEPLKRDLTCIVGIMPSLQPGETIHCKGVWKVHPEYGKQFEVHSFELKVPSDVIGIQKYLESGMIKGIGAVYAERIVKRFGIKTLDVIEETPDLLLEVDGIGEKRIERIKSCWKEQQSIRKVMIFLRGHSISPSFAQRIFKRYGNESIEKVSSNPYALAKEIHGVGFKTADQIAKNLGVLQDAPERVAAGIEHTLWELSNEGHTCYPRAELVKEAQEILGVDPDRIDAQIGELLQGGDLVEEDGLIFVRPLYLTEVGIARELQRLLGSPGSLRDVQVDKAVSWVQEKLQLELAEEQILAVSCGLKDKVLIITGGPGTGKSTITKAILTVTEKISSKIILAAPTGRAAKRLSEITGKKGSTIHSLLEIDFKTGKFKRNRENPLVCDLLIIDEASMIDSQLMHHLLKAVPSQARVVCIGDIDQLPSVGPGNVLKDMIASERIPVVMLKKIFRQAAGSLIVTNAHKINLGEFPDISYHPKSDFQFIEAELPEEVVSIIVDLVSKRLPKLFHFHKFDDIQVLSPMKRGIIGSENLNVVLQKELNPSPTPLLKMGRSFHIGDKVMQLRNNYEKEVYNGDVGKIIEIDMNEQILKVHFDGRIVPYDFLEIDELTLAYAVSIHKYQGSECPCVIIPVHTSHFKMLFRNLLYTGLTRGKRRAIFIGSKKALAIAVRNQEVLRRHTHLKRSISNAINLREQCMF
jgi:exodeoxyribonuclease V alpha subunit